MDVRKAAELGANVCPVSSLELAKAEAVESSAKGQLLLAGYCCTPTGLFPNEGRTEQQWEDAGHTLAHIERRLTWYIGDWLRDGENSGYIERGKLDEACQRFGIAYGTAADAAMVCKAFEQSSRRPELSFTHHREVANREDAEELLDWAEETAASVRTLRTERRRRKAEAVLALPEDKYRVIYADPPWKYGDERSHATGGAAAQYPLMSIESLCNMDVPSLTTDSAVLFLWVTVPLFDEAWQVIEAWGFEYKTHFVWDKQRPFYGNYSHVQHELLWLCTKGSCVPAKDVQLPHSIVSVERTKHSVKPHEFYELIEGLYRQGNRLELFARNARDGWDSWGHEAEK